MITLSTAVIDLSTGPGVRDPQLFSRAPNFLDFEVRWTPNFFPVFLFQKRFNLLSENVTNLAKNNWFVAWILVAEIMISPHNSHHLIKSQKNFSCSYFLLPRLVQLNLQYFSRFSAINNIIHERFLHF